MLDTLLVSACGWLPNDIAISQYVNTLRLAPSRTPRIELRTTDVAGDRSDEERHQGRGQVVAHVVHQ